MPLPRLQETPTLTRFLLLAALAASPFAASAISAATADARPGLFFQSKAALLEQGAQAFAQGKFKASAEAFRLLQEHFSEDPQWIEGSLPRKTLPLAGYAAWRSGESAQAIAALDLFLDRYADRETDRQFARYTLAMARIQSGDTAQAIADLQTFIDECPSPSQRGIAAIKQARLLFENDQAEAAYAQLDEIIRSHAAERVIAQARLLAIRQRQESGDLAEAHRSLTRAPWPIESMPELALLSFAAMEIGDRSLEEGRPGDALAAYRHVLPKPELERLQRESLAEIEARFAAVRQRLPAAQSLWEEFYAAIIANARRQLTALESAEDYTDTLLLRRGQSFLSAQRPIEAWLVFERCLQSPDTDIVQAAERLRIHAALAASEPDSAIALANRFLETYPNSADIWDVAYLVAIAYLDQESYAAAANAFENLSEQTDNAAKRALALHQAGYAYAQIERYPQARSAFQRSAADSDSPLAEKSTLWIGLIDLLSSQFEDALATFENLERRSGSPRLKAEAAYRIAATLHAMGDSAAAREKATLNLASGHASERHFDNLLLRALANQALGQHQEAVDDFSKVPKELDTLRNQAALGLSESYAALRQYDRAISALETRAGEEPKPQDAAELHLAWHELLILQGRFEDARACAKSGLETYGNAAEADGLLELALAAASTPSDPLDLVEAIESIRIRSLPTLLARLTVALSKLQSKSSNPALAEKTLLELHSEVSQNDLPPEALAAIGSAMIAFGSSEGRIHLERCAERYPHSRYATQAHFALARADLSLDRINAIEPRLYDLEDPIAFLHLKADALSEKKRFDEASACLESILSDKRVASRPKAEALKKLGDYASQQNRFDHANAYYQRAYTLYPAFADIAAASYLGSSGALIELNQPQAARRTLEEAAENPRFKSEETYAQIQAELKRLPEPEIALQ